MRDIIDLLLKSVGRPYLWVGRRAWRRLPAAVRRLPPGRLYGMQLHALVRRLTVRRQNHSTFFFRNRPELELIRRLANLKSHASSLDIAVLACSKGAEVYSIAWTIRSARPDLKLSVHAVDISQDILDFAKQGLYLIDSVDVPNPVNPGGLTPEEKLTWNTGRDQRLSIFERMTEREIEGMFAREGNQLSIKPWLKEGITWHPGDAGDPDLVNVLGAQDMVVANRFLCHMDPVAAERCLHSIPRLVKPGGHLLVSGVDLDVRTRVAREMGWNPITDLLREIYEGDVSLLNDWPFEYWALEPFQPNRRDCTVRYASAFQVSHPS
jgi:chemotaxis protein methyltransferase CheR